MKLVIYRSAGPPIEIEGERVRVLRGLDHFELREQQDSLLVRLEEHDGGLALDLAVLPSSTNGIRLRGGLR